MARTPSPNTSYSYQALAEDGDTIRLFVLEPSVDTASPIRGTLVIESLAANPAYAALSYLWGDLEDEEAIFIDGKAAIATINLIGALRRIRLPDKTVVVWADAICINQFYVKERNHQIRLMGDIYRKARRVICWLGPASPHTERAARLLHNLAEYEQELRYQRVEFHKEDWIRISKHNELNIHGQNEHWLGVQDVLERPYFTRVWTFQEMVLNQNVVLYCRPSELSLDDILRSWSLRNDWMAVLSKESVDGEDLTKYLRAITYKTWSLFVDILNARQNIQNKGTSFDINDFFEVAASRNATDDRDRVNGLLGLLGSDDFKADYRLSVRETYCAFAQQCIAKMSNLQILRCAGLHLATVVPSWVPFWPRFYGQKFVIRQHRLGLYQAGKSLAIQARFPNDNQTLWLGGRVCDQIDYWAAPRTGHDTPVELVQRLISVFLETSRRLDTTGLSRLQAAFRTCIADVHLVSKIGKIRRFGQCPDRKVELA
jgi:hypothetical protein